MSTDKPAIHLKNIIDTRVKQPPVWVAFPGSKTFQVLLRPLNNRDQEFIDQAQEIGWDVATFSRRVKVNQEKYLRLFCAWVIVDWQGLTMADLRRLVLLQDPKKNKDFPGPVACDEDAKLLLMTHSPAFSAWVRRVVVDVERFNQEREEELEKKPFGPSATCLTSPASTAASAGKITRRTAMSRTVTAARSTPGTERPGRCWRSTIWPAPGAILTNSGWRRPWTLLKSLAMSAPFTAELCLPCTGR